MTDRRDGVRHSSKETVQIDKRVLDRLAALLLAFLRHLTVFVKYENVSRLLEFLDTARMSSRGASKNGFYLRAADK